MKLLFTRRAACFSSVMLLAGIGMASESFASSAYGGGGYSTGTITTCDQVRQNDGKNITGGTAGLSAGGDACFSGGGQSFCVPMASSTYTCAGVSIVPKDGVDVDWRDFDISEEEEKETQEAYYTISTRDETRGRSGYDIPLFMNAHGICRKIDNTTKQMKPLFMGVKYEDEWRTVHGVPQGGDPNGGYTIYANNPAVTATMSVCCSPVELQICGSTVRTGYAQVGETASVWGAGGGHATVQCVGNNDWRTISISGICGGGGGGGGEETESGSGYYNPNNGGEISKNDWDNLPGSVKDTLQDQGYQDIDGSVYKDTPSGGKMPVEAPEDVKAVNEQAKEDVKAAQEAAEEEARRQEEENKRLEEEAKKAAEEAEREAQEEDDCDEDDDC